MKASHILLTTDFSEESRRAYAPAAELAQALGGRITLLHVVPDLKVAPHGAPMAPMQSDPEIHHDMEAARERMAEEIRLLAAGKVSSAVESGTDVAHVVAAFAKEHGVDLIAVSTHGRSGLRRLILGSSAEAILRHANVPVLCFPPPEGG